MWERKKNFSHKNNMKTINENFYQNWAISNLVDNSLSAYIHPLTPYGNLVERMEYADWKQDICFDENGNVVGPTEYKMKFGNEDTFEVVDTEIKFTKAEYQTEFMKLIEENEPEAFEAYQTVMLNK
jgi:hypothetical protein